jgi:hypothetical protein
MKNKQMCRQWDPRQDQRFFKNIKINIYSMVFEGKSTK